MSESTDPSMAVSTAEEFKSSLRSLLHTSRNIDVETLSSLSANESQNGVPDILSNLVLSLPASEAEAIKAVIEKVTDSPAFGGLDITNATNMTPEQYEEVLFLLSAHLEALNHARYAYNSIIPQAKPGVEPMTLAEKIFALHSLTPLNGQSLHSGSVVRVGLDWILASELSWSSMARTHASLGAPEIWRNDRFWLAGDHVVHPEVRSVPKVARMIDVAEKAKKAFRMTEYQGMNYTIMHTEFVRERAEPGMLCVGSDSHSCSAGAMGCLSIGLGAADVTMALVMGQTWFKIPEIINIELVGTPGKAIAGKDVILHILGELKRNTVASERIVEFTGEACQHLSIDARFAICNMCTEFGAVTGVFAPDEVTRKYVEGRRRKANRINSVYLKPDEGAKYAGKWTIDLSKVEHTVAVYPKPDHVVPVSEKAGMKLDGVFIGACTTTEEEIVLAALVLKAGLKKGIPLASGKRHYVPGSLPIVDKLGKLGLLEVYEQAGFTRGPPGCSYCVGISAEKAEKGEVWLSSQNRNFENRMGPGSFGNLSSAVVCAASSFSLTITDPAPFVAEMDIDWFENTYLKKSNSLAPTPSKSLTYVEPNLSAPLPKAAKAASLPQSVSKPEPMSTLKSTIITLGDYIDTDALAPGYALTTCVTDEEFGEHCLEQTHPDFRSTIKSYPNSTAVVVAGSAFGVGSSRENAVSALKGCGVKCVISKSFAFILGRNCPSLGLLAFNMDDETFYEAAKDGRAIEVDVPTHTVRVEVDGQWKEWKFTLSEMEYQLTINKGLTESFRRYGKAIFEGLLGSDKEEAKQDNGMAALELVQSEHRPDKEMDW